MRVDLCLSVCESLWPTAVDAADGARLVVGRVLGPPEVEGRHAGAGGALGQEAVDRRGAHDKGRRGWMEPAERSRGRMLDRGGLEGGIGRPTISAYALF